MDNELGPDDTYTIWYNVWPDELKKSRDCCADRGSGGLRLVQLGTCWQVGFFGLFVGTRAWLYSLSTMGDGCQVALPRLDGVGRQQLLAHYCRQHSHDQQP